VANIFILKAKKLSIRPYTWGNSHLGVWNHCGRYWVPLYNLTFNPSELCSVFTKMGYTWNQLERIAKDKIIWRSVVGSPYPCKGNGHK